MNKMVKYKSTKKITSNVISEILRVAKEKGLTAENLVETARDKRNPLHEHFEWDNSSAGEKWRIQQARVLINEVRVKVDTKEIYAFENVSVRVADGTRQRQYKPVYEILDNKDYRGQVLKTALTHLKYWKDKYSEYQEFEPIIKTIEKVEKEISKKWKKTKR